MPSSLEQISCPLCDYQGQNLPVIKWFSEPNIQQFRTLYGSAKKSIWCICGLCGFIFQNPRPSQKSLQEIYEKSQYHPSVTMPTKQGFADFARWYYQEKIEYAMKHTKCHSGLAYDLGCGRGEALFVLREKGFNIKGLEMDAQCIQIAEQFLGQGAVCAKLLTSNMLESEKADLVFSNHALEHFTDLKDAFKGLQQLVKPMGHVVTVVPTTAQNRSFLGRAYLNAAHYSAFSHHSLSQLFAKYGFKTIHHTYRGWKNEIDEVWHIAQYRPELTLDPTQFYENPQKVSLDINFFNPFRAVLLSPKYAYHNKRIWATNLSKHMIRRMKQKIVS